MRVLLAPDSFKGSLPARAVADALRTGMLRARPSLDVRPMPVSDGGEGLLDVVAAAGFDRVPLAARGPTGERVETAYARREDVAVVELADVCGLGRLSRGAQPLLASSFGAGEVVRAAVEAGCRQVVFGIGGSASSDGGAGFLTALGARLLDDAGEPLPPGGGALGRVAGLELDALRRVDLVVAGDVDNPLLDAARVYASQKGATPQDVAVLEVALARWADVVAKVTGRDLRDERGAGAAGGVGFAAMALLGARMRPGIDVVLELLDAEAELAAADVVVVGEGRLDAQTLHGKAPLGVARAASGKRVVAVCGQCALADPPFDRVYALTDLEPDVDTCVRDAAALLKRVGERLAADLQ